MKTYDIAQIKAAFFKDDLEQWTPPQITMIDWPNREFLAWRHTRTAGERKGFFEYRNYSH